MEIFQIYQSFVFIFGVSYGNGKITPGVLYGALMTGVGVWLLLFILQGVGMYTMAKNRNMSRRWLAFVPFANIYYMGKLAGACDVFGRKMKSPGLYAMLGQILSVLFCASTMAAEILLFTKYGDFMVVNDSGTTQWVGLTGFAQYAYNYYLVSEYLIYIFELIYMVLMFILLMGLYKKYYARGYFMLSWVAVFIPISRYIAIFVLRNNKAIDYEAYMRAKREEFMRRQQQQNPYGYNPYNQNPYNQNPYNRGPGGNPPNGGYPGYPPQNGAPHNPPSDDPFAEFSSHAAPGNGAPQSGNGGADGEKKDGPHTPGTGGAGEDDLFN